MAEGDKLAAWEPSSRQRRIRDAVARAFEVEPEMIAGRSRLRGVVHARHAACWVIRHLFPELSYPMIGRLFGGRDHSTIIYAVRQAQVLRDKGGLFRTLTDILVEGIVLLPAGEPVPPELVARIEAFTAERAAERDRRGVDREGKPIRQTEEPVRVVKAKNALDYDDFDALDRHQGSLMLAEALAREGMVCR